MENLYKMFNEDKMQNKIVKCKTMEEAFNIIKSYLLIGNFMDYQLATDINYSEVENLVESDTIFCNIMDVYNVRT